MSDAMMAHRPSVAKRCAMTFICAWVPAIVLLVLYGMYTFANPDQVLAGTDKKMSCWSNSVTLTAAITVGDEKPPTGYNVNVTKQMLDWCMGAFFMTLVGFLLSIVNFVCEVKNITKSRMIFGGIQLALSIFFIIWIVIGAMNQWAPTTWACTTGNYETGIKDMFSDQFENLGMEMDANGDLVDSVPEETPAEPAVEAETYELPKYLEGSMKATYGFMMVMIWIYIVIAICGCCFGVCMMLGMTAFMSGNAAVKQMEKEMAAEAATNPRLG